MASRQMFAGLDFRNVSKITNLPDPTAAQDAATKAYVDSAVEGLAWKDSVRAASTVNINLASPGTAIDGVTMAVNDRFLAKDQTTQTENGIYIFNGSAVAATRALDANTFAELEQAVLTVEEGTTNAATTWRQTQVNGTLGTNNVIFTTFGTSAPAASETTAGIAELATQAETDTGTDDLRIVTPLKLTNWSGRSRRFAADIGDGSTTSFTLTHNFNTREVVVTIYRTSGSFDEISAEIRHNAVNSVDVLFDTAPTTNQFRVVVSKS